MSTLMHGLFTACVMVRMCQVEILSRGAMGFIGIGFMTEDVNQARLPGWENHSYGGSAVLC